MVSCLSTARITSKSVPLVILMSFNDPSSNERHAVDALIRTAVSLVSMLRYENILRRVMLMQFWLLSLTPKKKVKQPFDDLR